MNENVKDLPMNDAETEPMTGEGQTPDQSQKPKKGFLKTIKKIAVDAYVKLHSNPVGRVACKLVKAGTAVLVVKGVYDKGFKDGQKNPVVVTITPIEGQENPEEAPAAEPETNAEADVPAEEPEKEELN